MSYVVNIAEESTNDVEIVLYVSTNSLRDEWMLDLRGSYSMTSHRNCFTTY